MGVIYTELKKISLTVLIADLAYICVSLVFKFFGVHIIVGAVLGYIFMALNFAQLGTTIERASGMDEKGARRYLRANYIVRYIIIGVVLAFSALSQKIDFWIVALTFLAPKITYTAVGFYHSLFKKEE